MAGSPATTGAARAASASAADLSPYVPRLVRTWPRAGSGDADGGFRVVEGTLVSADISGFTKLSEQLASLGKQGAEELTDLLNECFDGMIAICDSYLGDVLKFGGDALLVLFTGANHAERACQAALGMRASIARGLSTRSGRRVTLRVSIGAHSGAFTFFLVDAGHRELIVTGPAATRTVTCEGAANAGQILVSDDTAALLPPGWRQSHHPHGRLLHRAAGSHGVLVLSQSEVPGPWDLPELLPAAQQEQIAAGEDGEHRQVTIAFVKFSGTDEAIERLGPGHVARQLQALAQSVCAATARHGVNWLASDVYPDGGKIILTAGAPFSMGDDEERVLRTTREILDAVREPVLRAGVNQGHVFVGNLGCRSRRTFTVMGDAVNLAARLMQKAGPGELIATDRVLARARSRFAAMPLEPFLVKGKSLPIDAAAVGGVEAEAVDGDQDLRALPFVGRDRQLAELEEVARRAHAGSGTCVELTGEPGIGKTRLLEELRRRLPDVPAVAVWCQPYLAATPYGVMRGLLRTATGIAHHADRATAGRELAAWVERVAPELRDWLPLIAIPADADVAPTAAVDASDVRFRRVKMHQAVVDLVTRANPAPLLLRVEDIQWIDDASRDLLDGLLGVVGELPWLVCLTSTPAARPLAAARRVVTVEPLDQESTLALAASALGVHDVIDAAGLARIAAQSAGHPLFTIELVAAAVERGSVETLPDSIESAITAHVDTLTAADRALVRDASVLGVRFELDVLRDVVGDACADPGRWASVASVATLDAGGTVTFRHALLHRVVYEGLAYKRRRHLHRLAGEAMERRAGAAADEVADLLSLHFSHSEDHERAWRYSVVAGRRAQAAYANVEAAGYYRLALASAPRLPRLPAGDVADVAEALGDVCERAGLFDEAAAALARARRTGAEPSRLPRLIRKQGELRERSGAYVDALRLYGRALGLVSDPTGRVGSAGGHDAGAAARERADVAVAYAGVRFRQGRYRDCDRWAREAAGDAEASGNLPALAHALYLRDHAATFLGDKGARDFGAQALAIFERIDDHVGQANVLNNMGVTAYYEGRWDDAQDLYRRSRSHRDRAGDVIGAATAVNNIAEILSDQGHLEEAVAMFKEARREFSVHRYPLGAAVATANLGRAEARSGRVNEALDLLDAARAAFEELHAVPFAMEAAFRRAECLLAAGRTEEALSETAVLLDLLDRKAGDRVLRVSVLRVRAEALLAAGRLPESRALLEAAIALADALDARYELALCLLASAAVDGRQGRDDSGAWAQATALLDGMGVVIDCHRYRDHAASDKPLILREPVQQLPPVAH